MTRQAVTRALVLLTLFAWHSLGAQAPGEIPAVYRERLAPLLTPVELMLKLEGIPSATNDSGCIVLSERIISVDAQGRRMIVRHEAYRTLTDAAVSNNSDEVIRFRKREQQAYLILAETIQPDGSRQSVKPNAVLIQSPQRQAEYSLYDDQSEMKIIFPNVKPGSVTHFIVLVEDLVAKIPGEFNQSLAWGASWATGLLRFRIELPAEMASRLKTESIGTGVPVAVTEQLPDNRVARTWTLNKLPGRRYEIESPPPSQIGPVVNLSTIRSWDDIGHWYRGLVAGRDQPGAALIKEVDAWTAKATSPVETIAILHDKVANLVRYVGLEFGAADYQPHHCDEVWDNQYGDCKDKANLLVALLRHRGIPAHIALVNTKHLGLVDHRTPDYRMFDHAIVAISQKGRGYLFCDPTIGYSEPGMLSPGSADREVLVVTDNGAEWVRTPAQSAGSQHYQFDLKLAANGELSGWLTLTSEGYYGAGERSRFTRLDADDARSEMSKIVRGFLQGAEIVDVMRPESPPHSPYVLKTYFLVPSAAATGEGKYTLGFLTSSALFADLGDRKERETTYFMNNDRIKVSTSIKLPHGLHPAKVPAPFRFDATAGSSRAQWTIEKGVCRTSLELEIKQSTLKPQEFGPFYQSSQALQAWLAEPVVLTSDSKLADQPAAKNELDLPMLSSGDGQIDLVDKRYPQSGNQEMRRLALERTIQYFPKDQPTVFRVGVRLAVIDWDADHPQPAHDRLSTLLASYAGQIKPEIYSWAEVIDGEVLRDLKRLPEALARLERVARDRTLSDDRRASAAGVAADLMMAKSPADALALLREIAQLPDGAMKGIESRLVHLLLVNNQADQLREHLSALLQSRPDASEEILTGILTATTEWKSPGDLARLLVLVDLVDSLQPSPGEAVHQASAACRLEAATRQVHARLVELAAAKPLADWYTAEAPGKIIGLADAKKAVAAAAEKSDPVRCLQLCVQSLVGHGTEEDFPNRLWDAATYAEWVERKDPKAIDEKVTTLLLDLCDQLPATNQYFSEGKFIRAKRRARAGDRAGEQAILREMISRPGLGANFLAPASKELGFSLETTGDLPGALEAYRLAEPIADNYAVAADSLLRAVFIHLHLGHNDEALQVIRLLEKISPETIKATAAPSQIQELVTLAMSGHALECWDASRAWWPEWQRLAGSVGTNPEGRDQIVPIIPSLVEVGTALKVAAHSGNSGQYFETYAKAVSAARWLPSLASEIGSVINLTVQVAPTRVADIRRVNVAMLATPHPGEIANRRNRQLLLAAFYVDDNQAKNSLRVVADFNATAQPADEITRAMHRVHGFAALAIGNDLAPAAAALEADLTDPKAANLRTMAVGLLADLYGRLGRTHDAELLLKRELENPLVVADTNGRAALAKRYEQSAVTREFAAKVDAWVQSVSLAWYVYAEPNSLEDPRLRDLESTLKFPENSFQGAEKVKLLLLAARDDRRPLADRQQSLREAARLTLHMSTDYQRMNAIATSVVGNPDFDPETQLQLLWAVLINLVEEGRPAEYAAWRKNPLCAGYSADYQKRLALLDLVAAVDRTSPAAVQQLATTLTAQEVTSFGVLAMHDVLGLMLRLGDIAAAEALTASVSAWKLAPDAGSRNETIQLGYARQIRVAKVINSVHEALIAAVRARFPEMPSSLPAEYQDRRIREKLPMLRHDVTFQACLHLIRTRQFNRDNLQFWATFLRTLPRNADTGSIVSELAQAALAAATEDELRADFISLLAGNVDLDDSELRHKVDAALAPYRRPVENPLSNLMIRVYEVTIAARLGEAVDFDTVLSDLNHPFASYVRQTRSIHAFTQKGDRVALKRAVDRVNTDFLVNPNFVSETIPALELLGLEAELKVARDVAAREIRKSIIESWATGDEGKVGQALELALLLHDSAVLPAAWVADMSSRNGDPQFQLRILMTKAYLDSDWTGVEKQAAVLNRDFPAHYHYFWYRGLALFKLGRKEEAATALLTYTRYAKEELEYPKALELLKALGVSPPEAVK